MSGKYLRHKRSVDVQYEHPFCGYYPDVMSKDASIVVECGHTNNPEKMLAYFQHGNIRECIQVPYPDESDDAILGYSFIEGTDLQEFLTFLESEKRESIKKLLRKRSTEITMDKPEN